MDDFKVGITVELELIVSASNADNAHSVALDEAERIVREALPSSQMSGARIRRDWWEYVKLKETK